MNANLQRGAANTVNTTLLREVPGVFASHMFLCRSWWIQMDPDGSRWIQMDPASQDIECWWVLMGVFGTAQRLLFLDHLWHLRPSKSWQALALATSTTSAGSLCFHMFSLSPERIALKKSRSVRKCAGETWVSSWEEAWQMSRLDDCFACEWTEWTAFRGPGQEEWAWGCSQAQLPGTKGNRTMRAEIPWNPPTLWFYQVLSHFENSQTEGERKTMGHPGLGRQTLDPSMSGPSDPSSLLEAFRRELAASQASQAASAASADAASAASAARADDAPPAADAPAKVKGKPSVSSEFRAARLETMRHEFGWKILIRLIFWDDQVGRATHKSKYTNKQAHGYPYVLGGSQYSFFFTYFLILLAYVFLFLLLSHLFLFVFSMCSYYFLHIFLLSLLAVAFCLYIFLWFHTKPPFLVLYIQFAYFRFYFSRFAASFPTNWQPHACGWSKVLLENTFFPTSLCVVLVFGSALPPSPALLPPPSSSTTHTHNFLTHNLSTHNLSTHNLSTLTHTQLVHTELVHTHLAHTHTTCPHTTCSTLTHTHNLSTQNLLTHTTCHER